MPVSPTVRFCFSMPSLIGLLFASLATAGQPVQVVDTFDHGIQNARGGYRNVFHRSPSRSRAMRVREPARGGRGRSLRVTADRRDGGFCGVWIHFFDFRATAPVYFDARRTPYLSFWVRGGSGGERFQIKLADRRWIGKEDAVSVGNVEDYLPSGVTTQWQEVVVPLADLRLNLGQLAGLTLDFDQPGRQTVFVDDIGVKPSATATVPHSPSPPRPAIEPRFPRALWVWTAPRIVNEPSQVNQLLEFCDRHGISQLWVQVAYDVRPPAADGNPQLSHTTNRDGVAPARCRLRTPLAWRRFLKAAQRRHVSVHALDGYPDFALSNRHRVPLGVVDELIEFNRTGKPDERFDGVHFDNEPYLLLGWRHPQIRRQILREFLALNQQCQQRIRAAGNMTFGVDIPFWWQEKDPSRAGAIADVEFQGVTKAASFHLIDMLDNVGIMNYRDAVDGADGMIAHGRTLLKYAETADRATVYMGVETLRPRPIPVWFVLGVPRARFLERLEASQRVPLSRWNGFRIRTLDDGQRIHVGLEIPHRESGPASASDLAQLSTALAEIAAEFAAAPTDDDGKPNPAPLSAVSKLVSSNDEWSNLQPRAVPTPNGHSPGFTLESRMLAKITFADEEPEWMNEQLRGAEQFFSRFRTYGGTAIHYYESFRELQSAAANR